MMIQAVLSNPYHPEYGVATIPFPITHDQYAHCMELLEALEIGDAVKADCQVQEINGFYSVLKRMEMLTVNISHPQKNGRPTRLTCHLFCVTGAKSSSRLDGSTGWPATTASLYAPTGGMIMLRGGADTPSASCGSSMTRPSRKLCPCCWAETDRASFPSQSRSRSRRSQSPLPCRSLT